MEYQRVIAPIGVEPARRITRCRPIAPSRASGATRALRSRAFSLRSASVVLLSFDPMPASERSVSRRAAEDLEGEERLQARRRGPGAVPPARTDAARQRDRAGRAAARVAPEQFRSYSRSGAFDRAPVDWSEGLKFHMVTSGIRAAAFLCPSGHRMGLRQHSNPRVSSALIARSGRIGSHESQHHWNDKSTLVTLTLDDGRSSRAAAQTLAVSGGIAVIAMSTAARHPELMEAARIIERIEAGRSYPRRPVTEAASEHACRRWFRVLWAGASKIASESSSVIPHAERLITPPLVHNGQE